MLQVKSLILNLFLLMLRILLDLSPDANHKGGRFSKTLPEKSLEFVLIRGDDTIIFNLDLVLLAVKVASILEEQNYKRNMLKTRNIGRVKMVLALSTKIVVLHIRATII